MKAAPFDYVRPRSVEEACACLAADADAAIIAGGQTLVPMMAMRLARPSRLIDIARIGELHGIRLDGTAVVVGAATRQVAALNDDTIAARCRCSRWRCRSSDTPPRATAARSAARSRTPIRRPRSRWCWRRSAAYRAARRSAGSRSVAARDFFTGPMMTAMTQGDMRRGDPLSGLAAKARVGVGFQEISARRSDFALASAAAQVALDESGRCTACALGIGGAAATPCRLDAAGAGADRLAPVGPRDRRGGARRGRRRSRS